MYEEEIATYGIFLAATLWTIGVLLWHHEFAKTPFAAGPVWFALVDELRLRGFITKNATMGAKIRLGAIAGISVEAETTPDGSVWTWKPDATPMGNGLLFTAIFLGILSPLAVGAALLALFLFLRARRFARAQLPMALKAAQEGRSDGGPSDVRRALLLSLSECRRMALEAHEAERSRYWDLLGWAALVATVTSVLLFVWIFTLSLGPDFGAAVARAAAPAFLVGLLLFVGGWAALRRRAKAKISELETWTSRFATAFRRESEGQAPPPEESPLELVLQAAKEIPSWLASSARAGYLANLRLGHAAPIVGNWGAMGVFFGILLAISLAPIPGAVLAIASGAAAWWAIKADRRWRASQADARAAALDEWGRRERELSARLDSFAGGS